MEKINLVTMDEIIEFQEVIAEEIVELQYLRHPELREKCGKLGHLHCIQDVKYHFSFLKAAVETEDKELFLSYIRWVKVLLNSYNINSIEVSDNLRCIIDVFKEKYGMKISPLIIKYLEEAIELIPKMNLIVDKFINKNEPYSEVADKYLDLLLKSDRSGAARLIFNLVESGVDIRSIYLNIFQKTMYEIGRLWQMNKISVAQEHYCSAVTQLLMSKIYTGLFNDIKKDHVFVGACVSGELHEMGIRMVCDFLELEGWDTYYLGANTPLLGIVRTITEKNAKILGLSATMTYHVDAIKSVIKLIRNNPRCKDVKIIVGGYPFNISKNLWRIVGADGYSSNAEEACLLAENLIEESSKEDVIS